MRYFIIGAACAISLIVTAISTTYGSLPDASPVPTVLVAVVTSSPRAPCDIDEGIWKPWIDHAITTHLPDETPQVLSDTMVLSPPGGTVPMPNACLPQQTPQPITHPETLNIVEPASP